MPTTRQELGHAVVAAVHVTGQADRFLPVVRSLRASLGPVPIVIGGPGQGLDELASVDDLVDVVDAGGGLSVGELARRAVDHYHVPVLLVGEPVLAPEDVAGPALEAMAADPRIATVSFLSNAAAFASFPYRNHPLPIPIAGHDAGTITAALRDTPPELEMPPIAHAVGGAVVVSPAALSLVDAPATGPGDTFSGYIAELAAEAQRHGLRNLLDLSTYVLHADDLCRPGETGGLAAPDDAWFRARRPNSVALAAADAELTDSPLGAGLAVDRSKVLGLRLLVDGATLGPLETGAQVGLVALVAELARRDDIQEIVVTLPGPLPAYASALRGASKVRLEHAARGADLSHLGSFDVAYLSRQPDEGDDLVRLRAVAARVVVTVLDLIAYRAADYHATAEAWLERRAALRERLGLVDGVVAISNDVAASFVADGLPVESTRVFTVPFGVGHVGDDLELERPARLPSTVTEGSYLLCLGTNYAHKNRALARRVHAELAVRGHGFELVLAGPLVSAGSSRVAEARAGLADPASEASTHDLPDVTTAERNWLLQNAAVVLYPTSAEGFGLIPYEAAALGTPCVFVAFGPLAELGGSPPVSASAWTPEAFADAVRQLLDPTLARAQVDHFRKLAASLTWDGCAASLVEVFRRVLARPVVATAGHVEARLAAEAERDQLRHELEVLRARWSYRARAKAAAMARAVQRSL